MPIPATSFARFLSLKGSIYVRDHAARFAPLLLRRVRRAGPWLPRHGDLSEGDAQAQGVARAPVRGGQAVARAAPVPPARAGQREYGRAADRGRAEPQALAGRDRLGAPPWPEREPGGHRSGQPAGLARHLTTGSCPVEVSLVPLLLVTTARPIVELLATPPRLPGVFQRAGLLSGNTRFPWPGLRTARERPPTVSLPADTRL